MDLFEADWAALEAARSNLNDPRPIRFFWRDLAHEAVDARYDLVVMNPPFHRARAAEPELGQEMIRAAGTVLKAGGRLFLVANRGLPYETALSRHFSRIEELARDQTFKVIAATR